jgi:hypothetical protein
MVALASTDVTLTVNEQTRQTNQKRNRVTVAFGNGTLTYPSGGVPMPAIGNFGMTEAINGMLFLEPNAANGFVYKYDISENKIRIYQGDNNNVADAPLIELTTAATPAATTLVTEVVGW